MCQSICNEAAYQWVMLAYPLPQSDTMALLEETLVACKLLLNGFYSNINHPVLAH